MTRLAMLDSLRTWQVLHDCSTETFVYLHVDVRCYTSSSKIFIDIVLCLLLMERYPNLGHIVRFSFFDIVTLCCDSIKFGLSIKIFLLRNGHMS